MSMRRHIALTALAAHAPLAVACFSEPPPAEDPAEFAPISRGTDAVDAWLTAGHYLSWRCQEVREPRGPSVHGRVRVCANALAAAHGAGEFPVGAANVKELYDETDALVGVTFAAHTSAGTSGDTWFWFERSAAAGVTADGWFGPRVQPCIDCHAAAGSDAAHPGHDFVYTTP